MTAQDKLKLRLGITDWLQDEVIADLLLSARAYAASYCRILPEEVSEELVLRLAAEDYTKLASAGISYRSISGAYERYRDGYSADTLTLLNRERRIAAV